MERGFYSNQFEQVAFRMRIHKEGGDAGGPVVRQDYITRSVWIILIRMLVQHPRAIGSNCLIIDWRSYLHYTRVSAGTLSSSMAPSCSVVTRTDRQTGGGIIRLGFSGLKYRLAGIWGRTEF